VVLCIATQPEDFHGKWSWCVPRTISRSESVGSMLDFPGRHVSCAVLGIKNSGLAGPEVAERDRTSSSTEAVWA
jgi:hypothetical protein